MAFANSPVPVRMKNVLRESSALNAASIAAGAAETITVTVAGVDVGDIVNVGFEAAPTLGIDIVAWVSDDDEVSVRFENRTDGAVDPASLVVNLLVWAF
jgi:hypothetical protein